MLEPKLLQQQPEMVQQRLQTRGFSLDVGALQALEQARKSIQVKTQDLQAKRNQIAKQIGQAKGKGESVDALMAEGAQVAVEVEALEKEQNMVLSQLRELQMQLPNLPHESVPVGKSEEDNVVLRKHGTPRKFEFTVKDHIDLGLALGQMDFEAATQLSGARFTVLKGDLARLHRVLGQFMLDMHTQKHGYQECYLPYLVEAKILEGTGQLPKMKEDLFAIAGDRELYLIPTAEVPMTNLIREQTVAESTLPRKWVAHTPCFRSEAGAYGKDTRGFFRQHQFDKVELVQIVHPDHSYEVLESLTKDAAAILEALELPYQVLALCTGDLGQYAAKTYDLEVWLPAQDRYREISSCSNTESYQARRMQARFKTSEGKTDYVHTLNGSGVAIGRALIAIMENYQLENGDIQVPRVLRPYMGGLEVITKL